MMIGRKLWIGVGAVVLVAALAAGSWWARRTRIPEDLAWGNGRIEADEADVATRYAGRLSELLVEEGDPVEPDQPVARMDTGELEAALREAEARVREAIEGREGALALIVQRESECELADSEYRRSASLFEERVESKSELDVRKSRLRSAHAACAAAEAQKHDAEAGIEAAKARVDLVQTQIHDATLVSPVRGRVLYRLAKLGEVLPAGGKVLTLIDLSTVSMELFVPSRQATRIALGAEARIVLDALPEEVIPARVTFVSPDAQFTPRQVETPKERDKLMFRVKVKVPDAFVTAHLDTIKTGIRGVAYVALGPDPVAWPDFLVARSGDGAR